MLSANAAVPSEWRQELSRGSVYCMLTNSGELLEKGSCLKSCIFSLSQRKLLLDLLNMRSLSQDLLMVLRWNIWGFAH